MRGERPRDCCAAEERDEIASPHRVPQPEGHILSYRRGNAVLCITAKSARQWQLRVIFDRLTRSRPPRIVRFALIASAFGVATKRRGVPQAEVRSPITLQKAVRHIAP